MNARHRPRKTGQNSRPSWIEYLLRFDAENLVSLEVHVVLSLYDSTYISDIFGGLKPDWIILNGDLYSGDE